MTAPRDRILVVENDPIISDMIGRQILQPSGYQYLVVSDASSAINRAMQFAPDAIIAELNLPGLSGKDLLVALTSQGLATPVILLAPKGNEADIIQTFRLGAADYLTWPAREPEVINVVERVLKQVHDRHERERLSRQLHNTNQELQQRVRELTAIFSVGKAVTSVTDQSQVFEKILEGATHVTQAELGWFLLRDEASKNYLLVAGRNLPASLPVQMGQPWDDGISSLVALSGEALAIHGEPLKRFKIAPLGQSALIVPVKVQKQVIGLLVMMRKQPTPFTPSDQHLLEALADYAAISLVNARLFRTVEDRARMQQNAAEVAQLGEKVNNSLLLSLRQELRGPMEIARSALDFLAKDITIHWTPDQRQALSAVQEQVGYTSRLAESLQPSEGLRGSPANLTEITRLAVNRMQPFVGANNLSLAADLPNEAFDIQADGALLLQAVTGLLNYVLRVSTNGSQVGLKLERTPEGMAHLSIHYSGPNLNTGMLARIFDKPPVNEPSRSRRFFAAAIGLPLVKDVILKFNGKTWAERKPGQTTLFHILLPLLH
ncbi:histidine kinase [Longilinea arvoryzae]|uniref:Histidine kinase n=1 Tax=Longilinea arvoryzae TaxID=360412 RepID=A0A0S7BC58_9CHLR|nr:response regulator [Longilinea arvoryzae]GAP12368.1 histidine kinase [Longilinea arvoryzae]